MDREFLLAARPLERPQVLQKQHPKGFAKSLPRPHNQARTTGSATGLLAASPARATMAPKQAVAPSASKRVNPVKPLNISSKPAGSSGGLGSARGRPSSARGTTSASGKSTPRAAAAARPIDNATDRRTKGSFRKTAEPPPPSAAQTSSSGGGSKEALPPPPPMAMEAAVEGDGAAAQASKPAASAIVRTKPAGKYPPREDTAPSRHAIVKSWSGAFDPILLFNCGNARCELVGGEYEAFGDSQDGVLKVVHASGEAVGKVTVARAKAEPFMNRVELKNRWLVGEEHGLRHNGLDRHATLEVVLEWKRDDGTRAAVQLRIWPWISYACTAGSRLKVAIPSHEFDGACVTVQRVLEDDRCVCTVDVVDRETVVDPRPDTVLRAIRPAYERGARLLVLHKHTLRDATVLAWLGKTHDDPTLGGRHLLRFDAPLDAPAKGAPGAAVGGGSGAAVAVVATGAAAVAADGGAAEEEARDLNEYNHSMQRFDDAVAYEVARKVYCAGIVESENQVEDAITGNQLRIEDQLICVSTQNIGETIKVASTP